MDAWLGFRKELWHQVSAFGGIALSVFAVVFSYVIGYKLLSLQFLLEILLALFVVVVIRSFFFRQRPDKTSYKSWLGKLDASSFPSMHSIRVFGLATILSINFPKPAIIVLGSLVSLAVAFSRVRMRRHHVSDVVVGSILGVLIGFVSVWLTLSFI